MTNESKSNLPEQPCEKSPVSPTTILKVSNSSPDIKLRESTVEVHHMPAPGPAPIASVLLPGEHKDIRIDVCELLDNGETWLTTPNLQFLGRRPSDLIGTPDEQLLRDTLRSAIYSGMA